MNKLNFFNKHILNNERGVSLIEIIIALLILSLLVIFYVSSATTSFTAVFLGGAKTVALNFAREKVEEIKSSPVNYDPVLTGSFPTSGYTYVVTKTQDINNPKLYTVTVTVNYNFKGQQKSVNLSTIVFWEK